MLRTLRPPFAVALALSLALLAYDANIAAVEQVVKETNARGEGDGAAQLHARRSVVGRSVS
jgi:hypothetical protein